MAKIQHAVALTFALGALAPLAGCGGDETYVAAPRYPGGGYYNNEYRDDARDVRQNANDTRRDVRQNANDTRRDVRQNTNDARRDTRSNVRQYNQNR